MNQPNTQSKKIPGANSPKVKEARPDRQRGRPRRERSEHFEIAPRRKSSVGLDSEKDPSLIPPDPRDLLHLAVPKKLLKRAVDRNAVRRVAREAWLAHWRATQAKQPTMQGCAPVGPSLLRLTSRPLQWAKWSRPARKRFWRAEIDRLFKQLFSA